MNLDASLMIVWSNFFTHLRCKKIFKVLVFIIPLKRLSINLLLCVLLKLSFFWILRIIIIWNICSIRAITSRYCFSFFLHFCYHLRLTGIDCIYWRWFKLNWTMTCLDLVWSITLYLSNLDLIFYQWDWGIEIFMCNNFSNRIWAFIS